MECEYCKHVLKTPEYNNHAKNIVFILLKYKKTVLQKV